jgi:hypothetical protein
MKCPYCGLTKPPEAMKCDCGFNFKVNDTESESKVKYNNPFYEHPFHA